MAIGASTVWRVRPSGSDLNGAGYDSTVSGAGTDYTQQDSPQLSLSDLTSTASTTITSVTGGFTSAMVGNLLRISSGTGATTGYYVVTTYVDTNTITVDRVSGTYTAGVGRVGGGAATLGRVLANGNATGDKVVAGNVIYVRGAGSDAPSAADYTYTASITPVTGTLGSMIKIIGENGRPRFDGSGQTIFFEGFTKSSIWLENVMIKAGNDGGVFFRVIDCQSDWVFKNVAIHTNDLDCDGIRTYAYGNRMIDCEFMSHATAPTTRSGRSAIKVLTGSSASVKGCVFYRLGGNGITCQASATSWCDDSLFLFGKQHGLLLEATTNTNFMGQITRCTINGNTLDGINIADGSTLALFQIIGNLITNHNQASRYGINVASGTTSANDLLKVSDYNAFYNNTSNVNGITLSTNDQSLGANPYTQADPPTTDWSVGTGVKALGFPHAFRGMLSGVATTSYVDIGGVQRQESGGGVRLVNVNGGADQ